MTGRRQNRPRTGQQWKRKVILLRERKGSGSSPFEGGEAEGFTGKRKRRGSKRRALLRSALLKATVSLMTLLGFWTGVGPMGKCVRAGPTAGTRKWSWTREGPV